MDPDVAAAVDQLRRAKGVGVSAAVNELIRRGLRDEGERPRFEQRTSPMGARIDVTNVAEALEILDGPAAR
jgi:hypothetical protein